MRILERTGRRLVLSTAMVAGLGALLLIPAAAAHAETSVLVSTDGVHYAASPLAALYRAGETLVPGGARTAQLDLQNPTTRDLRFSIYVTDIVIPNADFARALSMRATTQQGARSAIGMAGPDCQLLVLDESMPAGSSVRTDLALAMSDVSGAVAQGANANFNLRVRLSDAAEPAPAAGCADGIPVPAFGDPAAASSGAPSSTAPSSAAAARTARALAATGIEARYPLIGGGLLFGLGTTLVLLVALRRSRRSQR